MKYKKEIFIIALWGVLICIVSVLIKWSYEEYSRGDLIFWSMFLGVDICILIDKVLDLLNKLDKDNKNDRRTNK